LIRALHPLLQSFELTAALGGQRLFDGLKPRGHGLRIAGGEGFRFLAIALQRELRGV
jgi:hypothetical protein